MDSFLPATTPACPNITLTTDFGLADPFVGMMKGVIAGICPQARVIDITHGVEPFHILDGAVKLWQAARYFPAGTIHVAVVDPGVGSERRALLVRIGEQWFIAPDNGLLSWVVGNAAADVEVWLLEDSSYFLPGPGHTFHGRDIFAPCAAHLACGVAPGNFGHAVQPSSLVRLQDMPVSVGADSSVEGRIVVVDRFGNLLTNIRGSSVPEKFDLEIGGHLVREHFNHYAAGRLGVPFAIVGSSGLLEIAVTQASAAEILKVRSGAIVTLRTKREPT